MNLWDQSQVLGVLIIFQYKQLVKKFVVDGLVFNKI